MSNRIELPETGSRAGILCAYLLLGHKTTYRSWNQQTGLQGVNQRADDLRKLHLPLLAPRYKVEWSQVNISVYQFPQAFIERLGKDRKNAYIKAVSKLYEDNEDVKKGLQSKPQPLRAILSGQAVNSEVANV